MVGSGLKKLAKENGMKVAHGIAYGSLQGYAATMSEGSGYKQIVFATRFADPQACATLAQIAGSAEAQKEYRLRDITFNEQTIVVNFTDSVGTMDKIRAFIGWFIPLLCQYGASPWNVCLECGGQLLSGRWIAINGVAYYMHETCAAKVRQEISESEQTQKQARTGSYGSGAVGALLGAALGAVVWSVVLMAGYVASLVGLLIGWLAEKGYGLLHGKQGKPKVAILIGAVILGVAAGTLGGYYFSLVQEVAQDPQLSVYSEHITELFFWLMDHSADFRQGVIRDFLMGLIFAGLGVFGMMRKTSNEVSGAKILDLE